VAAATPKVALIYDRALRPDTTGEHCAQALRAFAEVSYFSPERLDLIPSAGFDLYLNIDDGLHYRLPGHLRPSAWWAIDTHLSYPQDLEKAGGFDYVFAAQREGAERLRSDGAVPVWWLPLACNPELHRPLECGQDLDVAFVGNPGTPERQRLLGLIRSHFPNSFVGNAYGDDMARVYSRAKIVFNRSVGNDVNMRVFEALACRALLLTNALPDNGQDELLEPGKHLVTYSSDDELLERIHYYLAHDEEREAIAEAGYREAVSRHTYALRMQRVLEACLLGELEEPRKPFGYYHFTRPDLLELIPREAQRVLDVGCGAGCMGRELKRRQDCEVRGLEHNPYAAAEAGQRLDAATCADAESVELEVPAGYFDCVVCGDILEHLKDPQRALQRLCHHLADGGTVVASLPNVRSCEVLEAFGRGRWGYCSAGILDEGHLRFFALHDVLDLLAACGLEVQELQRVRGPEYRQWLRSGRPNLLQFGGLTVDVAAGGGEELFVQQYLVRAVKRPQQRPSPKLVSIIILTCNELEYTKQCVESILAHTQHPYELIFVDNGSGDDSPAYLAGLPNARVIRNETNLGFPKGCNQGLAVARGDYVLLLNNDTIVTPGWLSRLVVVAESDPRIGLVGPVSNCVSGPQQVEASYQTAAEMQEAAAKLAQEHRGTLVEVERLVGFCLLIKREVLDKVGALDERYGLGLFEDDDLCLRARQVGYRLVYAPEVFIHHFGSRTFAGLGIDGAQALESSKRQFEQKWGLRLEAREPPTAGPAQQAKPLSERRSRKQRRKKGKRPSKRASVSLCMIVKNEEANLPRCLDSVRGLFDEVIVVDTGSEDATTQVARQRGAKVHDFPWVDDFSAARNESLNHASSEWVMWLDADDSLDAENRARLRKLIASLDDQHMGYVMKVRCLSGGDGGLTDVDHVKLFRNLPELRFEYRVHEQILPAIRRLGGEVAWSDVVIHHHGYQEAAARRRKLERDRRILGEELRQHPDDPFCLFNLGCIEQELGHHGQAIAALRRSIELSDPHDSQVRKAWAMVMQMERERGQPQAARAAYDEARAHYPTDPELLFQAGLLYRALGDHQQAERSLLGALQAPEEPYFSSMDPGLRGYKARHNLAVIYLETGRPDQAEEQWRAAIAEAPDFAPAWEGLAELLMRRGDGPGLSALGSQARRRAGSEGLAQMIEARCALGQQQFDTAIARLRSILEFDPRAETAQRLLTYALLQAGRMSEAELALRRLLQLAPDDAEAQHNLAALLCELKRYPEAIAPCECALRLLPQKALTYYVLADAYERMGSPGLAADVLRRLLAIAPQELRAHQALGRLHQGRAGAIHQVVAAAPGTPGQTTRP